MAITQTSTRAANSTFIVQHPSANHLKSGWEKLNLLCDKQFLHTCMASPK
jgi:hypothetical protein